MKIITIALLYTMGFSALAASQTPRFWCYSYGNQPADAYLNETSHCDSKSKATCLYAGGCMVATDDKVAEPPSKNQQEVMDMSTAGTLKPSYIHCEAKDMVPSIYPDPAALGQKLMQAVCPSPSSCFAISYQKMPFVSTEATANSKPVPITIPAKGDAVHD